ncbi:MAG: hypothetical protein ACK5XT_10805 [Gemmatimonas sp.]|uniref:hypothetical protein n=1 Tax=Gemmatimonas sp. TaxID=1962908 RepID=UPI00391F3CF4
MSSGLAGRQSPAPEALPAASLPAGLRVGDPSPIVRARLDAAAGGKEVLAFVELQTRFDEAHTLRWARRLERAGGRVVCGRPELMVHALAPVRHRRRLPTGWDGRHVAGARHGAIDGTPPPVTRRWRGRRSPEVRRIVDPPRWRCLL